MIPVDAQPEPASFDAKVRQKGLAYLKRKGFDPGSVPPHSPKLHPYWRDCLDELHQSYNGICAYLCVYIVKVTGGCSVDHFVAKSKQPDLAYEWGNYRLACSRMNSRKREYDDVLDPFTVGKDWFHIELVSGRIYPNPELKNRQRLAVQKTIDRLGLDDAGNREMRAGHYQGYCENKYTSEYLQEQSPFVWQEAHRQGLL
ncbi:MAG: hypothetical protein RDU30_09055 [Desulfovibrionaceae bacterium]|nr:hypothetical protein [Desulfovibrionaceae bacterium]